MQKKGRVIVVYLVILIALASLVLATSKPISGYVLKYNSNPAENATVSVYVNVTTFLGNFTCHTVPDVYTGANGSYSTNFANLKYSDNVTGCSADWNVTGGDFIWAIANGSTVINPGPQGNGNNLFANDLVENGTGLQFLTNFSLAANPSPVVNLISPVNSSIIANNTVIFNYNVTDDLSIVNCSLIINGTINQTDVSITQSVAQNFTATLANGNYNWSIGCTDNSGNTNFSAVRSLGVSFDSQPPNVYLISPTDGLQFFVNETFEISVNVTDDFNVSSAYANITYPNGTNLFLALSLVGGGIYNNSFTMPNLNGTYLVTFFVNDTSGNLNNSVTTYFTTPLLENLVQIADRLNYYDVSLNHTVSITNNDANYDTNLNITLPSSWNFLSGTNCTNISATIINCNVSSNGGTATYTVSDPGSLDSEYKLTSFVMVTNNTLTGNNITFIKIQDKELFHTLVEYGRGRGNYFFDSQFSGAGSGHTEQSCPYVPNSTLFELNYLHKVLNVGQYYGSLSAQAYNASFSCTYPNRSVIREHLITSIATNSSGVYTDYLIGSISQSWERMGYLTMDFMQNEQFVGQNFIINCTNMSYYLPVAYGYIVVDEDSFTLEIRDREPFIASASTGAVVGNGTQEVLITYNVTNSELYPVDDVIIEIAAPQFGSFIGTRSELWGVSQENFRLEKSQLDSNESVLIELYVRMNTTNAGVLSSMNLTQGVNVNYVTCWELNAYNPIEYTQLITGAGVTTVNQSINTSIISIPELLSNLLLLTQQINTTVTQINQTVTDIEIIVDVINTTTQDTNILVDQINATSNTILNTTNSIIANTNTIINDTSFIIDELNCNGTIDSALCIKISSINTSIYDLWNLTLNLNNTAKNLNITVIQNINLSGLNITTNVDLSNLTADLREIKSYINCTGYNQSTTSVCNRLDRVENLTIEINSSVQSISNFTNYFNSTVFGNITFQDIVDSFSNITVDTSEVLLKLQDLREFDQELVFLVTDSFGMQQQARSEFLEGDVELAANSLRVANKYLSEAKVKLDGQVDKLSSGDEGILSKEIVPSRVRAWIFWTIMIALIALVVVYVGGRVVHYYLYEREEDEEFEDDSSYQDDGFGSDQSDYENDGW